ncbi:MAG: cytochrome c biogenesis protein ResB [Verrucomicrobiota bacterium]
MSAESPTLSPPETPRRRAGMMDRILSLIGSYHIAVVVFLLMILLTLLGTFSQKTLGLYQSLNIYFTSWVVPREHWLLGFIPLPGMALLLAVMFVNLLAGGVIRIRKNWRTVGNVIAHLSMLGLIAAGAVSLYYKQEGHMRIFEGESSNRVQAFQDWVLEVREAGGADSRVYMIHETTFRTDSPAETTTFHRTGWPFELKVSGYQKNATVTTTGDSSVLAGSRNIDGYTLRPLPVNPQHEANMAGIFLDAVDLSGKTVGSTVLAQVIRNGEIVTRADAPFSFAVGDRQFAVNLTRETWEVPFSLKLDDFKAEYYPGTRKAKEYESHVTMTNTEGKDTKFRIWMNNPLRDSGYVAYQTSFDDQSPPGQEKYSVLTVVKNPSDQWPLYSMIAATVGLLITFLTKLARFIRRTAVPVTPSAA